MNTALEFKTMKTREQTLFNNETWRRKRSGTHNQLYYINRLQAKSLTHRVDMLIVVKICGIKNTVSFQILYQYFYKESTNICIPDSERI